MLPFFRPEFLLHLTCFFPHSSPSALVVFLNSPFVSFPTSLCPSTCLILISCQLLFELVFVFPLLESPTSCPPLSVLLFPLSLLFFPPIPFHCVSLLHSDFLASSELLIFCLFLPPPCPPIFSPLALLFNHPILFLMIGLSSSLLWPSRWRQRRCRLPASWLLRSPSLDRLGPCQPSSMSCPVTFYAPRRIFLLAPSWGSRRPPRALSNSMSSFAVSSATTVFP